MSEAFDNEVFGITKEKDGFHAEINTRSEVLKELNLIGHIKYIKFRKDGSVKLVEFHDPVTELENKLAE